MYGKLGDSESNNLSQWLLGDLDFQIGPACKFIVMGKKKTDDVIIL